MTTRLQRLFAFLVVVTCAVACSADFQSADIDSDTGRTTQLLTTAGSLPTPRSSVQWSLADLIAADAWAQCSFLPGSPTPVSFRLAGEQDRYLDALSANMENTMTAYRVDTNDPNSDTRVTWLKFRANSAYNVDGHGSPAAMSFGEDYTLSGAAITVPAPNPLSTNTDLRDQARDTVAAAPMNLCTAMLMRRSALRGDLLLTSEVEQQKLAEITRERNQMSVLQYAGMLRMVSKGTGTVAGNGKKYQVGAYIKAAVTANPATAATWVSDLAAALQLHLVVTSELAEMFLRSSSARTPRGGNSELPADEDWGPGSWKHRFLALLFGGDPLAGDERGAVPWQTLIGTRSDNPKMPGVVLNSVLANVRTNDWPSKEQMPYVATEAVDARVALFRDVATASSTIPKKGSDWFNSVNSALVARCNQGLLAGGCKDIGTNFQLTQGHAQAARQILEELTAITQVGKIGPFFVGSGITVNGDAVRLDGKLRLVPRPVVEYQASFARMTPYPWPMTLDVRAERTHPEVAVTTLTTKFGQISVPIQLRVGDDQGIPASGILSDAMRVLGAVPTLAIVREGLNDIEGTAFWTTAKAQNKRIGDIFDAMLSAIGAAIGDSTTMVRAIDVARNVNWLDYGLNRSTVEKVQEAKLSADGTFKLGYQLDSDLALSSPLPNGILTSAQVFAVPDEPKLFGLMLTDKPQYLKTMSSVLVASTTIAAEAGASMQGNRLTAKFYLPVAKTNSSTWSFVLRIEQGTGAGSSYAYVPLAPNLMLRSMDMKDAILDSLPNGLYVPIEGQYLASGGQFGVMTRRALARNPSNPARSAYDGFGLPTNWVPSVDATAYGSNAGDTPVDYLLRNAKQAAQDATDAVKTALEGVLAVQRDTAEIQTAQARSAFVANAEKRGLCGPAECNTAITQVPGIVPPPFAGDCDAIRTQTVSIGADPSKPVTAGVYAALKDLINKKLTCMAISSVGPYATVSVGVPVAAVIDAESQPTFDDYAGGSLQTAFIQQWAAVRELRLAYDSLTSLVDAAQKRASAAIDAVQTADAQIAACMAQVAVVNAEQQAAKDQYGRAVIVEGRVCNVFMETPFDLDCDCGVSEWQIKYAAIHGLGEPYHGCCKAKPEVWQAFLSARANCFQAKADTANAYQLFSEFHLKVDAQNAACAVFDATRQESVSRVSTDSADGMSAVVNQRSELAKIGEKVAAAVAAEEQLATQAALAFGKQQLEAALTAFNAPTSFRLWRQVHHYDTWRARALLDGARRYAVAARRAIEERYVVDLSTMRDKEPFVAAPYLWADSIYHYDLSLPTAVGLSLSDGLDSQGVYVNQVLDYVGNLEKFVAGFAVARPASAALRDGEVIWLPGPKMLREEPDGHPGVSWLLSCESSYPNTTCSDAPPGTIKTQCSPASLTELDTFCQAPDPSDPKHVRILRFPPSRAKVVFQLDPWGRLDAAIPATPYQGRVNVRWNRVAVNLVGAGVRKCAVNQDPQSCWSQPFLRYNLVHRGPVTAIGYDLRRASIDIPTANIEGAKALAANELLDPVLNGWGKPYVESIARAEFQQRPLGGTYELELEAGPGVSLDSIERVQILLTSDYWVLQTQ